MAFPKKDGDGDYDNDTSDSPKEKAAEAKAGKKSNKKSPRPCPFCDSKNVSMHGKKNHHGGSMQYQTGCSDCGAMGPTHYSAEDSLSHWNADKKPSKGSGKAVYG